jgi:hypothetical protein
MSCHLPPSSSDRLEPMGSCPRCGQEQVLEQGVCAECGTRFALSASTEMDRRRRETGARWSLPAAAAAIAGPVVFAALAAIHAIRWSTTGKWGGLEIPCAIEFALFLAPICGLIGLLQQASRRNLIAFILSLLPWIAALVISALR